MPHADHARSRDRHEEDPMNRETHDQQAGTAGPSPRTAATENDPDVVCEKGAETMSFHPSDHDQTGIARRRARATSVRQRRRGLICGPLAVLFLVVCLLAAGFPPFGGVAHADVPPGDTPPADLLNFTLLSTPGQPFYATPAQIASLKTLQQKAIQNLLTDHQLPSDPTNGEQTAAQTWGRTDALAELYGLITQAIELPPACTSTQTFGVDCRDTDQQNAVDWLTSVYHAQKVQEAQDAGLEYAKWAGRDQVAYKNLLATLPSDTNQAKQDLANFFCDGTIGAICNGHPLNYFGRVTSCPADTDSDTDANGKQLPELDTDTQCRMAPTDGYTYTAGYCVYHPPVPYDSEYYDGGRDDCLKPTTGFYPAGPSYDQFVKWGAADANFAALSSFDLLQLLRGVAIGVGLSGVAVAASAVLQSIFKGTTFASVPFVQAFQRAVLPFASRAFLRTADTVGEVVSEGAEVTGDAVNGTTEIANGAAEIGGAVGVAGILFMAASVIIAIAESIAAGIIIGNSNAVPFQLADLISQAPGKTYDLKSILGDSTEAPNLFVAFLEATQPTPTYGTCVPLVASGILRQCLNAPPIPAPDFNSQDPNHDPFFAIQQGGSGATTYSTQLTWLDQQSDVDGDGDSGSNDTDNDASQDTGPAVIKTARVHENWFITQLADLPGTTVQTLRLHYTDWSGNGQNAWLFNDPTNGYEFLSVPDLATGTTLTPSTCQTDHTCTYSSSIQYVGADGSHDTAHLVSSVPASTIIANPDYYVTEGTPVTFTETGVAGATYSWQFQQLETCPDGFTSHAQCTNGATIPSLTAPVSGASASYTWNANGLYEVWLQTTLSGGASSTSELLIHVVPVTPTLTLSPVAPSSDPTCAHTNPCDVHAVQVGNTTTLTGIITHGGKQDNEHLTVDWGDGAPGSSVGVAYSAIQIPGFNASLTRISETQYAFSATHTYAKVGTYTATVTASQIPYYCDTCGGSAASATVTEHVWAYPSLAWSTPQAITYGTPLSATQLDATATYNGTTVPGTFAYTGLLGNFGLSEVPVNAGDVLPVGTHSVTAHFIPSDPDVFHEELPTQGPQVNLVVTPAPLTVSADNQVMVHGGTAPSFTASASGLVNNDSLSSLGVTCAATDHQGQPISASTPVGTYPITCSGPSSTPGQLGGSPLANYTPTYQPGTLFITHKQVTLTGSSTSTSGSVSVGGSSGSAGSLALSGTGGTGTLALAKYSANPGPDDSFNTTNAYFDVALASGSTFTSLQLVDCNLNGGNRVYWFNGTTWVLASNQSYDPTTHCDTVTIADSTRPSLSQLGGTYFGVLEDFTPPTTQASATLGASPTTYTPGTWTNQPVAVTLSAQDNAGGAGLDTTYYSLDGGTTVQYTPGSTITVSSQGKHTLTYWSTDLAGNVEDRMASGNSIAINIDTTAPTISASATADGKPYTGAWTNRPVTVSFTCADQQGLSGIKTCPVPVVVSSEGKNQQVSGTAYDLAGNSAGTSFGGINIDLTKPVVTYSGNATSYTVDQTVSITCSATDPVSNGAASGVASTTCHDVHGPAYGFGLGSHAYSAQATDNAGNVGSGSTAFVVRVTFDSLCNLTQQLVPAAGHPQAMCAVLQAASHATASKAKLITVYQHLVDAQVGHTITSAQAKILDTLASAL
jgi:hypothetical protein